MHTANIQLQEATPVGAVAVEFVQSAEQIAQKAVDLILESALPLLFQANVDTFVGTQDERRIHPFNPERDMEDLSFHEIALSLSNQCRYGGHVKRRHFFSIAQHSVIGSYLIEEEHGVEMARAFLMHDVGEFWLTDQLTPIKQAFKAIFGPIEARATRAVFTKLGMIPALWNCPEVAEMDRRMLATEMRDLKNYKMAWGFATDDLTPLAFAADEVSLGGMAPDLAYFAFARRFKKLFPELEDEWDFDAE